jgi:hypothetical protein
MDIPSEKKSLTFIKKINTFSHEILTLEILSKKRSRTALVTVIVESTWQLKMYFIVTK